MTSEPWDSAAATFDEAPDNGLADPAVRAAWRELLLDVLPPAPAQVADLGCGTGTLTRLLSDGGYRVDGLDLSPEMLRHARRKAPGARFVLGDAADPALERAAYDVVLCRHVLWVLPSPEDALARWVALLKPGGVVVLVEGRWSTGAGLTAQEAEQVVRTARTEVVVRRLGDAVYWGGPVQDERYLLVSRA
ncbi:class I SAM-dependent methyltransferase [Luteimicrobium sp. DT211]|uniref:class I SAM-dependent methyltransferase n=1 Tax=Luteimicrobium sp. DT211 TaxID=3393412 RepID=UPI003CF75FCD